MSRAIVTGLRVIDVAGGQRRGRSAAASHLPPQVAVGDDAEQPAVVVDDARHAEPLARHLVDDVAHARVDARTIGRGVAAVHQRSRRASAACRACRRGAGSRSPPRGSPFDEQRHRQRVAERQRRRRARGRHQVHRARFLGDAAVERDVGRLRRASTPATPVIAISLRAEAPDRLEQPQQLVGLAAVRQRDHDVVVAGSRRGRRGSLRPGAGRTRACRCSTASRRSCGR